ncbi:MAG: hypothetical protein K1X72_07415 [Pyrinomonadaceae bacterium]|nr:hypothetical protein [Pyrinomonadaceae bacterium]
MKIVKQHLIGIVLFSLIVGSAIFVNKYFSVFPKLSEVNLANENVTACPFVGEEPDFKWIRQIEIKNVIYSVKSNKFKVVLGNYKSNNLPKYDDVRFELVSIVGIHYGFLDLNKSNFNYNKTDGTLTISKVLDKNIDVRSSLYLVILLNEEDFVKSFVKSKEVVIVK